MKRIAIIIGSESDLAQCQMGLEFIKDCPDIGFIRVYVRSQHRNTLEVQMLLYDLIAMNIDVVIVGAGWANHLTGCVDAFLRYTVRTENMPIVGVAFEDCKNSKHTQAAILSMTEVPGTQVFYKDNDDKIFVGADGFLRACEFAVTEDLSGKIKISEPKRALDLTLEEAITKASAANQKN